MTRRRWILLTVAVLDVLLIRALWPDLVGSPERVTDRVGLISRGDRWNYNRYLALVQQESGVDLRILLVPSTRGKSLEQFTLDAMRELHVGRSTGGRGVLIVYDTLDHAMRIEIGPKLQGVLPDAFVGYLIRNHLRPFFGGGQAEVGLRTSLFMVHWRIRMARLGEEYDPSFEEYIRDVRRLASGGGVSGRVPLNSGLVGFINTSGDSAARAYFRPQPTVEAAYRRYHEWLAVAGGQTDVPLFTPESQAFLRQLPISRAFNEYLLAAEYGRGYAIDRRGDLAMLYFTDDPFISPKFLRRDPDGWRMDIRAELANSQEAAGGWYTWRLLVSGDDFSRVFADRYLPLDLGLAGMFYRVAGGDNRSMAVRGNAKSVETELAAHETVRWLEPFPKEGAEYLTVWQAAQRIRQARGRPAVVVLYGIWNQATREQFPEIVSLAKSCRERGVEFLAFHKDANWDALVELPGFLARHSAPFPPLQLYPWRSGVLDATMRELDIDVGQSWTPPLVAVLDRSGRVLWQGQGVSDWTHVREVSAALEP